MIRENVITALETGRENPAPVSIDGAGAGAGAGASTCADTLVATMKRATT